MPNSSDDQGLNSNEESIVTRRLKSFPPADLRVVIGSSERVYRHHAFILASYSSYVDTMLSTPMQERANNCITFPDIEPETWEKMIGLLEPGAEITEEDIVIVLPYYDKYQFFDGIRICDKHISDSFSPSRFGNYADEYHNLLVSLAVMSYNLNLPRSKDRAIQFATNELTKLFQLSEEQIIKLLPLVENDDELLIYLVLTLRGRHCRSMSIEEMRSVTKEDTFPHQLVKRKKQLEEQENIMKVLYQKIRLPISVCAGRGNGDETTELVAGTYRRVGREREGVVIGAMRYKFVKPFREREEGNTGQNMVLEALDCFGLIWELALLRNSNFSEDEETFEEYDDSNREVLFRWDGGYSSLVPPKHGWEDIGGDSEMEVGYSVDYY